MSKGCFQVSYYVQYRFNVSDSGMCPSKHFDQDYTMDGCCRKNTFIPKTKIDNVKKFDTLSEYKDHITIIFNLSSFDGYEFYNYFYDLTIGYGKEFCHCIVKNYLLHAWSADDDDEFPPIEPPEIWPLCTCCSSIFPLYEITVQNNIEKAYDNKENVYIRPKLATYVLDKSEHEHMERYLAGTDDALYDLVHLLRYMPSNPEVINAGNNFDEVQRKRARENVQQEEPEKEQAKQKFIILEKKVKLT